MELRIAASTVGEWVPALETRGATRRPSRIRIASDTAVQDDEICLSRFTD
ncbi:hypothetical protein [Kitasatospora purpeofusca]